MDSLRKRLAAKYVLVLSIMGFIAVLHAVNIKASLHGKAYELYVSYFSDIVIPFGLTILLSLNETIHPALRSPALRALVVFAVASLVELLQRFGVYLLGTTFDPMDLLMYAIGCALAVAVETLLLRRLPFWNVTHTT
jgi:hypothetical protein